MSYTIFGISCDRCGKEIIDEEDSPFRKRVQDLQDAFRIKEESITYDIIKIGCPTVALDLCPNCRKEFLEWLNNGKDINEKDA